MRTLLSIVFVLSMALSAAAADGMFVLVRHAEKVDDSRDPELSEVGKRRAQALAALLTDMRIDTIYSSEFIRTRETARPLAERLGVAVTPYDPNELEALAAVLKSTGGRTLVVGHSNSTPKLVAALSGEPGAPIEDDEYDRLYIVYWSGGRATTAVLRYQP